MISYLIISNNIIKTEEYQSHLIAMSDDQLREYLLGPVDIRHDSFMPLFLAQRLLAALPYHFLVLFVVDVYLN